MSEKENEKLNLLRELIRGSRRSDRELAKVLKVSQPTVTRKRTHLELAGYVKEYTVIPNLTKMGFEIVAFTFLAFTEAKPELLEKARQWAKAQPNIAHYDHLGYGGENSLYRGGRAIHNGADDNASGTTAMLMLAERLRKRDKQNNYLFIAFSGEEEGLIGSNIFVKNPTIDLKKANYMINLDMVGRMKDSALVIYGTGTSPVWRNLIGEIRMKELKIKKENSGIGPSDQTSFYLQDIPVLHFFTGQHEDYHRPSDDADKINFNGMYEVVAMIDSVVSRLNASGKIGFTKTTEQDSQIAPKFSVTLGVVPDYVFDGIGMRIDGISSGRPAQQAGLKKGDIVIKMGPVTVKDMVTYMQGLSKFKKGDTTTVWVKRESKILPFRIKF